MVLERGKIGSSYNMESMIFRRTNSNEIKPSSRFFVIEESNTAKT
jgi:hypothetical protein